MHSKYFMKGLLGCALFSVRKLLPAIMVLAFTMSAFAKMYEEPKSFSLKDESQEKVERKVLPKIDIERLLAEDRARGKNPERPGPQRFAVDTEAAYSLENSGTWQTLPDGKLWRLSIQSPGAMNMNLGITRFEMPEGAKLWVYDPGHKNVEGPYTSRHRSHLGSLWTPVIQGDEIVVEVFVPSGASQPVIEITSVNQGYRLLEKSGIFGTSEGTCENDVICPVGDPWRNQIRAVGLYTVSGTAACTGNLMNDTALDFKPYILSANHCGVNGTNDASIVFYWNFQSPTCGTHGPGSTADNQTGAIYHASYAPSDFLLFELSAVPDPSFNVFYAGWDASGTTPPSTVGIHQPSTDVKAISFSNSAPQGADWTGTGDGGTLDPAGNHWRIDWSSGVTEEGSSGSCIFATDTGRCIGQLHGGPSACGLPQSSLHDYYGKFSVSWNGGGTAATRLKDWLDPGNTGTLSMDGDPHITTANGIHYDFQGAGEFVALRDKLAGLEIQTRQTPIATSNPPTDGHDGLSTCVSLNTAVAARVGKHRVTYEPNLNGMPDPSGLQLRVDGALTTLTPAGKNLGGGGRVSKNSASGGLEITFPDSSILDVTPLYWGSESTWYLDVDVIRPPSTEGLSGSASGGLAPGGIMGAIANDDWLPVLPDGTSMGPMPATLHQRYLDLYQKFADAWRVTDASSLFDYAPGTSTGTFTMTSWPPENPPCVVPNKKPVSPVGRDAAELACRAVRADIAHKDCVFDVMITGNTGFGRIHQISELIRSETTRTTVTADKNPSEYRQPVTFTATVVRSVPSEQAELSGTVQFMLDGRKVGVPVKLDRFGRAVWRVATLKPGKYEVSASYIPAKGSTALASTSLNQSHTVKEDRDLSRQ